MKYKIILLFLPVVFVCKMALSQTPGFVINMSAADSLREAGDIKGAIAEFKKVYADDPDNPANLYNYACALSIDRQTDSCFKYLYLSLETDASVSTLCDPDFISIWDDKRWNVFEDKLISIINTKFNNPCKDIEYAKALWRMQALDQAYYNEVTIAEKKTGMNSSVVRALWNLKHMINEKNQKELITLLVKKGWPKNSEVGPRASNGAFLVIQHSDVVLQKKYLPAIKKLCEEKEASWQSYALMYDRIQTDENKPQKYGSQVKYNEATNAYELFPLEDETKVDEWRKEIGMMPLADYVSRWNIKFEPGKK